jgi:hypothetical protein
VPIHYCPACRDSPAMSTSSVLVPAITRKPRDFCNTVLLAAAKRIRNALPNDGTHLLVGMGIERSPGWRPLSPATLSRGCEFPHEF